MIRLVSTRLVTMLNTSFIRFAVIGALAAALQLGFFYLLLDICSYEAASTIALIGSTIFAYIGNRIWAFRSTGRLLPEFIAFVISRIIMICVNDGVLYCLVSYLSFNKLVSEIIAIIVTTIGNFFIGNALVFRRKDE